MKKAAVLLGLILLFAGCSSRDRLQKEALCFSEKTFIDWKKCYEDQCQAEVFLSGNLSLQDALRTSLQHNKKFLASLEQKNVAKGKVLQAISLILPHVFSEAAYTRMDEAPKLGVGASRITIGHENNYSVDLHVRQALFHGGMILSGIDAAQLFSIFSDETIKKQLQQTIYMTTEAYYRSLLAQALENVNDQMLKTAKAHLQQVQQQKEHGYCSDYDVLRSEVEVTNFEAEKIRQQNASHLAMTQLFKIMGASQDSKVLLGDALTYEPFNISFEDAVQVAFTNRPDLMASDLQRRMQKEVLNIAKSEYLPKLDAVFSNKWGRPDPHTTTLDSWGRQWSARLSLKWPLFEGLRRHGKIKEEKAKLVQQEILYQDMQETVLFELQKALFSLEDSDKLVLSQKMDLKRAKKALELAEVGFKEGRKTQVEVMDALGALTKSQSVYYKAIFSHLIAKLDLDFAMGRFDYNLEVQP